MGLFVRYLGGAEVEEWELLQACRRFAAIAFTRLRQDSKKRNERWIEKAYMGRKLKRESDEVAA